MEQRAHTALVKPARAHPKSNAHGMGLVALGRFPNGVRWVATEFDDLRSLVPGGRSERKDTTVVQNYFAVMEFVFPFALRTNESSVRTVVHQHELVCTALDVGMIARGARW